MTKNLVIVESPAKAKTIEGFLGKDFLVKSSYGHVRDLVKNNQGVEIANQFRPIYERPDDKLNVVRELKKLADASEVVWLASDEDREGEAISWHLKEVLGLHDDKIRRIVFNEITKPAILRAIEHPRSINQNLVDAQQARRILDRLVGFEISPVLWKKVKPSLSAGRVQSVAVRLIVEREREIIQFQSSSFFKVSARFLLDDGKTILKADLPKRFDNEQTALAFLEKVKSAAFSIGKLETKPLKKSPAPPFTTSTLQQEAGRKLRFSVSRTMRVAQSLYESGKITYMRTDSVHLSDTAINASREEIRKSYGEEYSQTRQFKTKSAGAQEAHEAIRPTYFNAHRVDGERDEQALYELIWKRAIASQMADARIEKTVATISVSTADETFIAEGEVVQFDGFLKVYLESKDDEHEETEKPASKDEVELTGSGMLPPLHVGQLLSLSEMLARQGYTRPQPRYTESSLVKKLEELGIGRPSTYAPTISTIQNRGYVAREDREGHPRQVIELRLHQQHIQRKEGTEMTGAEKAKLFPTDIGTLVTDFLNKHFQSIMDFHFTAKVEQEFDHIAHGKLPWVQMLDSFYGPFHSVVNETIEKSERVTGERILGENADGKIISVRMGRYGAMAVLTDPKDAEAKPQFASLRGDQKLELVTLEDVLKLFQLPRLIGSFEGSDMTVNNGRFGPYVKHTDKFVSLPKGADLFAITEKEAIDIILEKREKEANRTVKKFDGSEVQILNGRWGPYITDGTTNAKIPKDREPASLSLEECLQLIAASAEAGPKKGRFAKKTTTTTTAAKPAPKRNTKKS